MHPEILKRVIGNDGTHLKICSAILLVRTISNLPWDHVLISFLYTGPHSSPDQGQPRLRRCVRPLAEFDSVSQHADYPAVIPYSKSKSLFNRELSPEDKSVRGSLVTGLSESDVQLLDVFEGDVRPLPSPTCSTLTYSGYTGVYTRSRARAPHLPLQHPRPASPWGPSKSIHPGGGPTHALPVHTAPAHPRAHIRMVPARAAARAAPVELRRLCE